VIIVKLAFCRECWDVFKLDISERSCKCGKVRGRYVTEVQAEVTPNAISIAIGNGSLMNAIHGSQRREQESGNQADRANYQRAGKIEYAWVRPNSGPGNPHTRIKKD